jgi:hypothetical protein
MCFGIEVKHTRRTIIMTELEYIVNCKYCEKNVYETVVMCPYCTCKIGHPTCITNNKCPVCEEYFEINSTLNRIKKVYN